MINKANAALMDFCATYSNRKAWNCLQIENNRTIATDGSILGIVTRPRIDESYPKYQYAFKGQGKALSCGKFSINYLKKIIKLCEALETDEVKIKMYTDAMICLASNKETKQKAIVKLMKIEDEKP